MYSLQESFCLSITRSTCYGVEKIYYLVAVKYNAFATFPHKNEYIMSAALFEANFQKSTLNSLDSLLFYQLFKTFWKLFGGSFCEWYIARRMSEFLRKG